GLADRVRYRRDRWPRLAVGGDHRGAAVPLDRDAHLPRRRPAARQHPAAAHRRDAPRRAARPARWPRPAAVQRAGPAAAPGGRAPPDPRAEPRRRQARGRPRGRGRAPAGRAERPPRRRPLRRAGGHRAHRARPPTEVADPRLAAGGPTANGSTNGHRPPDAAASEDVDPTVEMPVPATERAAEPDAGALLSCRGIDMAYGPVQILFGVDFDVAPGEIVALLGTNGAGKSTLLKGICGPVRPKAGTVTFKGEDVTSLTADVTTRRGISLMPGGKGVFPTLTVAENLRLASWL